MKSNCRVELKKWIKDMTIRIRQIKKDKANAYRENRLEDAKQLEDDHSQLRQHVCRHHWYETEARNNLKELDILNITIQE